MASVIDVDVGDVEVPFKLVEQPFGESQPGTLNDVVSASFELCLSIGKQHRILQRNKKRVTIVCAAAGKHEKMSLCTYRIYATADGPDRVSVRTVRTGHKCGASCARQRQVKTSVIAQSAPAIGAFVVAKGRRGGNAKQLQTLLRQEHGIRLKTSQVHGIISSKKGGIAAHLAQYRVLPSLFSHLQKEDPSGIYSLMSEPAGGTSSDRRFVSFFVAPSAAIKNAQHYEPVATVDCGHLTGITQGQLCALMCYDADKHISPMCFALFRSETEGNWQSFMAFVFKHFPHFKTIVSDGAKGLASTDPLFLQYMVLHARCAWHILEKNAKSAKISMTKEHKARAWCIIKARDRAYGNYHRELLALENPQLFAWLEPRLESCATYPLIEVGVTRRGLVTSNPNEQFFSAILPDRGNSLHYHMCCLYRFCHC